MTKRLECTNPMCNDVLTCIQCMPRLSTSDQLKVLGLTAPVVRPSAPDGYHQSVTLKATIEIDVRELAAPHLTTDESVADYVAAYARPFVGALTQACQAYARGEIISMSDGSTVQRPPREWRMLDASEIRQSERDAFPADESTWTLTGTDL